MGAGCWEGQPPRGLLGQAMGGLVGVGLGHPSGGTDRAGG